MTYEVKTGDFEGPLDLLLSLIEEQKLDITQVSLAHVTDQYLVYIQGQENISLAHLADFLSVAAKLIVIKSKALLPLLELNKEEEEDIKDLEWQLAEFKKFKDSTKQLRRLHEGLRRSASRKAFVGIPLPYAPPERFSVHDIKKYFLSAAAQVPLIEKLEEHIISDVVSLEEKITHVQEMIRQRAEITFTQMTQKATDRMDVVISFLALLELVKQKIIVAEQHGLFDDISVRTQQKHLLRD